MRDYCWLAGLAAGWQLELVPLLFGSGGGMTALLFGRAGLRWASLAQRLPPGAFAGCEEGMEPAVRRRSAAGNAEGCKELLLLFRFFAVLLL